MSAKLASAPVVSNPVDYSPRDRSIYRLAGAAFDLIDKYGTPPAPMTYTMWYAYAANSPEVVAREVDEILSRGDKITHEQIEDIFEAHLSSSYFEAAGERVSQAIETSLGDVTELIEKTSSETKTMQGQLESVGSNIPKRPKRRDVVAMFEQLMTTNTQMSSMTETLAAELEKSRQQVRELNEEFQTIKKQSRTDALTDVANRRAFNERLSFIHQNAVRTGGSFSLALIDLDKFKLINDTFGHPMGDKVLSHFANLIIDNIEENDFAARIGGDEFAIIFPDQIAEAAFNALVGIKLRLERANIHKDLSRDSRHQVTFSCGIAQLGQDQPIDDLIAAADEELLRAKRKSRNFISVQGRRI
ncbi:MAG: GGDEF domain-containing protein [Henriciella sp.]